MSIKRFLIFFSLILLLMVGLTACERSLAPSGVPTDTSEVSVGAETPSGTSDVMEQIWLLATQTELARQGQTGPQETTAVPTVEGVLPTATPQPAEGETAAAPTATKAPAATAIPVPAATAGIPKTYTLQKGEFPFCIARRFNVNVGELLNASGLNMSSKPPTGYVLHIPQTGNPFDGNRALRSHPDTYTAGSGDTLNSIACLYGDVSPDAIATANGLKSPYSLTSGQTLQIP